MSGTDLGTLQLSSGCTISIIIPVFNRPRSVVRAARSALAQQLDTADTLEVVLVDDGSAPALSLDTEMSDIDGVRVVRLDANGGPAIARNRGINAARGDYIAFLDSDDIWETDKLARQLACYRRLQATRTSALLGIVCGFYYPNYTTGRLESRMPIAGRHALQFASGCWAAPGSSLLLHRSAFDRIGLFDERLRRLEDYDLLLRFGLAGGLLEVADYMGAVIAPSGLANSDVVAPSVKLLAEKYGLGGELELSGNIRRRFTAYLELERAAAQFTDGHTLSGIRSLMGSLILKPRMRGALLPFWRRSQRVPENIVARYRELAGPSAEVGQVARDRITGSQGP